MVGNRSLVTFLTEEQYLSGTNASIQREQEANVVTDDWRPNAREAVPEGAARPRIEPHPEYDGVQLVDPIEKTKFTLLTSKPVEPRKCDSASFYFPVDTAATIDANGIKTPYQVDVWIRDIDGELVNHSEDGASVSVPVGTYNLELSSTRMNVYLSIESSVTVESVEDRVTITCPEAEYVGIGIRSLHERPAATVTTTDDPEDLMTAISTFGSALKTMTCERSFPTLRGHPPLIELGESVSIPNAIEIPETEITIRVPPQYDYVYPVTSLAYYLGATVEPGNTPELVAGGESYELNSEEGFEQTVPKILKQIFLLDCVTRTEGYYNIDLHERGVVEKNVDLDFARLYQKDLAEQIQTYLSIPYEQIADAVPEWKLTADVVPEAEYAESLPFLASDLAIIRCPTYEDIALSSPDTSSPRVQEFFDALDEEGVDSLVRTDGPVQEDGAHEEIFHPPQTDSVEHTYVGQGIPLGTGKMTSDAFHKRLNDDPSETVQTRIAVVCNDREMASENVVSDIYDTKKQRQADIEMRYDLTMTEFEELLRRDIDFLHYIGHINRDGILCSDGHLRTQSLDQVNTSAFLLNACESYSQGRGLVDNGARGGAVTISKIADERGVKIGKAFAVLLSRGLPLGLSFSLIDQRIGLESNYLVVGDLTTQVIENKSSVPEVVEISKKDDHRYDCSTTYYFTDVTELGSFTSTYRYDTSKRFLCGNGPQQSQVTEKELEGIDIDEQLVLSDAELPWLDAEELGSIRF